MARLPKVITDEKLMKEWDYAKNNELGFFPDKLTLGSGKMVWWICPKGHEYDATITMRHRGQGCKYCAGKAAFKGFNDFESKHPDIAKEWHPTKNGDLKPDMVTFGSGKSVWWLCPNNHEYQKRIAERSKGAGCPKCSAALKTSFPEQAIYYYIKQVFPDAINRYTDIFDNRMELDIYIPSINVGIEYDGAAYHRAEMIFKDNLKYEICRSKGIMLVRVMEISRASGLLLYDRRILVPNSNRKHLNSVISELCFKLGRPVNIDIERDKFKIMDYVYAKKESLLSKYPLVAEEWDYEVNSPRRPEDFAPHSNERVGWICKKCGNKWTAAISERTRPDGPTGCPECAFKEGRAKQIAQKIEIEGSLFDKYPELMEEWDFERNTLDPKCVLPGSSEEAYWICKECGHRWKTRIINRTSKGHGCRLCSHQETVTGINDLATSHPELLKEWDYEKNKKKPTEVMAYSNDKYYWKCPICGHRWQATLNSRVGRKSGCPGCSGRVAITGTNDFKMRYPEYAMDWDYEKNEDLPEDYLPGSNHPAHWKCSKCGHEWFKSIKNRVRNPACPKCRNHLKSKKVKKERTLIR